MPIPYPATARALAEDRGRGALLGCGAAAVWLALWAAWAGWADVTITVESVRAELVPAAAPVRLVAKADGIVVSDRLALGRRVQAGDALLVLGSGDVAARLAAADRRAAALAAESGALARQQAAVRQGWSEESEAQAAGAAERRERVRQAESAAALADDLDRRAEQLGAAGLVSVAETARSRAAAEQARQAAAGAGRAAESAARQGRAGLADRAAAAERLAGEAARLEQERAALAAERVGLAAELGRFSLRAPAAGLIVPAAGVREGAYVARGAVVAELVAEGVPAVEAHFGAEAAGAVRPGQRAWVQVPAGVTVPAAVLAAVVTGVAPAAGGDGTWEVRLALAGEPVQGRLGMACRVEVEVARTTPAAWVRGLLLGSTAAGGGR